MAAHNAFNTKSLVKTSLLLCHSLYLFFEFLIENCTSAHLGSFILMHLTSPDLLHEKYRQSRLKEKEKKKKTFQVFLKC